MAVKSQEGRAGGASLQLRAQYSTAAGMLLDAELRVVYHKRPKHRKSCSRVFAPFETDQSVCLLRAFAQAMSDCGGYNPSIDGNQSSYHWLQRLQGSSTPGPIFNFFRRSMLGVALAAACIFV